MAERGEPNPFHIDSDRLDEEWMAQPAMTRRAGVREADAGHDLARAKARLAVVEAELRLEINRDWAAFGFEDAPKVAEVSAAVQIHADYQQALAVVHDADYALDIAKAEKFAFVDRRKALERLVELIALDYHAEREPRPVSAAVRDEITQRRRRSVRTDTDYSRGET